MLFTQSLNNTKQNLKIRRILTPSNNYITQEVQSVPIEASSVKLKRVNTIKHVSLPSRLNNIKKVKHESQ